jgi:hypothetical protein
MGSRKECLHPSSGPTRDWVSTRMIRDDVARKELLLKKHRAGTLPP